MAQRRNYTKRTRSPNGPHPYAIINVNAGDIASGVSREWRWTFLPWSWPLPLFSLFLINLGPRTGKRFSLSVPDLLGAAQPFS